MKGVLGGKTAVSARLHGVTKKGFKQPEAATSLKFILVVVRGDRPMRHT